MRDVIKAEHSERSRNIADLWATRPMIKRTLVAVGVQVMGQFTGINGILPAYLVSTVSLELTYSFSHQLLWAIDVQGSWP